MGNVDRSIDPETRDYVENADGNGTETTRTALPQIYHQVRTELGQWWGDPDAGSRFHELRRAKSLQTSPLIIRDMFSECLSPLVIAERITDPVYEQERNVDRIDTKVVTTDVQSGEQLELTELLPFAP